MKKMLGVIAAGLLWMLPVCGWIADSETRVEASADLKEAAEILREGIAGCLKGKAAGKEKPLTIKLEQGKFPELDAEGFRIDYPDPGTVRISGNTPLGIRHGACVFLERCLGVRWLFSGPLGTVMPVRESVKLDGKAFQENPVYLIRAYALEHSRKQDYRWVSLNRGNFHYEFTKLPERPWFQHNLSRLLPQEKYTVTNPEFFPIRNGKRFLPKKGNNVYWQYCYSAPGLAEAFAREIEKRFQKHPKLYSISLGNNDGARYCECSACRALDKNEKTSLGEEKHTASLMHCLNQIARLCAAPGRSFGFLAYSAAREPSAGLKLEPGLVPFLTFERLFWANAERGAKDREISANWLRAAGRIGWYDYLEYKHFLVPKISLHVMPEALRWGAKNHVKYYYAEAYPSADWNSGPMLWIILRLTWDPAQPVEALLHDWCCAAVGAKAAPALEEYYRLCSDFWEKEVSRTPYFSNPARQFLNFGSGEYLAALKPETLDRMKDLLEKMNTLAQTGSADEKARAAMIRKAFADREPRIRNYMKNALLRQQMEKLKFKKVFFCDFNRPGLWTTWQRGTSHGTFLHNPAEGIKCSGALEMNAENAFKDMVFMKNIKVTPGHVYRIRAKVRTAGTAPSCIVRLGIAWGAPGKNWLDSAYNGSDTLQEDSSFAWRQLSVIIKAPDVPGCFMRCKLSMDKTTKGHIFWDDVLVEAEDVDASKKN